MSTGLARTLPQLAARLAICSLEERRALVLRACERALSIAGVREPVVSRALDGLRTTDPSPAARQGAMRAVTLLEEQVDGAYLDLWDDASRDEVRTEAETAKAMELFRQARALGALRSALEGNDVASSQCSMLEALASVAGQSGPTLDDAQKLLEGSYTQDE